MGRNRRPIIIAAVLTVVAMILINVYTGNRAQQIEEKYKVEMGTVYIAVDDIPTGTSLTEDLFVQRSKPIESLPESRILTIEEFNGKTNTITIFKDQFLIPDFLEERRVEVLSTIIPHNKRAATIAVNRISGVGGHLVPGDNVDIIGSFDEEIAGYPTSLTLFDNVHILAVGMQTARISAEAAAEGESETAQATNITLSISPQDVKKLVLAENYGELKLALRGTNDTIPIPPSALPLPSLLQDMGVDPFAKQKQELEWEKERARYQAIAEGTLDSGAEQPETPGFTLEDIEQAPQRTIKVFLGSEEKDYFLVDSGTDGLDDLGGVDEPEKKTLKEKEKELEGF